jgi:uncharacterized protein (TIGR02266 family)
MSEKKQVLIICRSNAGQMYLGVLLNRIWFKPIVVHSVDEGIDAAQTNPFSVILFDIHLPDDELDSALTQLRSDPVVKDIPLVVFVTKERIAGSQALVEQGCSAVVAKPLDLGLLYSILNRLSGQPRATARVPVKMRVDIEEGIPAAMLTCINISEGGLFLRTAAPLAEGTVIHMRFTLPRDVEPIEIAGRVVRTIPLGREVVMEPGMGLCFLDLPEDVSQKLKNFVQWEMIGDLEWEATI